MRYPEKHSYSLPRRLNAYVAVALIVLLVAHASLGTVGATLQWRGELEGLMWLCLVVIVAHVVLSICTTYFMYADKKRPPSQKKKRHQVLKWISGCAVLAVAFAHIGVAPLNVLAPTAPGALVAAALMAALAWHSFVGVKSLTRDLGLPSKIRTPLRVALIVVAAILCLGVISTIV